MGTASRLIAQSPSFRILPLLTRFSMWTDKVQTVMKETPLRKTVIIFGIESHVCVLQTTLDLLEDDYRVVVLADGVSSMNRQEVSKLCV
jgi:nicotinamidase-related amidase